MKNSKPVLIKKISKQERERRILLGLVEYYIQTGKPVGSNTLKEAGFGELSSATIRNYFANLEDSGFLMQSHASGGRIPTNLAYRAYAQEYLGQNEKIKVNPFEYLKDFDSREIAHFLQNSAEKLSHETQCAIFLSAPRFDHDFIVDIKLISLDASRCLSVVVTDFGVVKTEVIYLSKKLSQFAIKRIENYFRVRITGLGEVENLENDEKEIAKAIYHELLLRYIVGYSNFIDDDIYRTGFSHLLNYPDFQETTSLASGLALFENVKNMRILLNESKSKNEMCCLIGDDLIPYSNVNPNCSVIIAPYYINQNPVGAIGILGPTRMPYRELFCTITAFAETISSILTRILYKFKISFRQAEAGKLNFEKEESHLLNQSRLMLLEDKRS